MDNFFRTQTACCKRSKIGGEVLPVSSSEKKPVKLTVAEAPNFASDKRALERSKTQRQSTEEQILSEIQNTKFKARPLNRRIFEQKQAEKGEKTITKV